jgi:hypothetical protein
VNIRLKGSSNYEVENLEALTDLIPIRSYTNSKESGRTACG